MHLGSYWDAFVGELSNDDSSGVNYLANHFQKLDVVGLRINFWDCEEGKRQIDHMILHEINANGIGIQAICSECEGSLELKSGYPLLTEGIETQVLVDDVFENPEAGEGFISGFIGDALVDIFMTDYLFHKNELKKEGIYKIALSGLALSLGLAGERFITLSNQKALELMEGEETEKLPSGIARIPKKVSTLHAAWFFPLEDDARAEFHFQGPIIRSNKLNFNNSFIYRLEIEVMREVFGEETAFRLPVYVTEYGLRDGYEPNVGDPVNGYLWLQGNLVDIEKD